MTSLNPVKKIGWQLEEAVPVHRDVSRKEAREPRARGNEVGEDPPRGAADRRLPAPVLGRHAPARDDRDGAHQRAGRRDRRRADDGARRDDAGADPGADESASGRAPYGDHHDHPRSRGRRRGRRRCDRHVRRPGRRACGRSTRSSIVRATRTPGACSGRYRVWTSRWSTWPRFPASRRHCSTRLQDVASIRGARSRWTSAATDVPPLLAGDTDAHLQRCWLDEPTKERESAKTVASLQQEAS